MATPEPVAKREKGAEGGVGGGAQVTAYDGRYENLAPQMLGRLTGFEKLPWRWRKLALQQIER